MAETPEERRQRLAWEQLEANKEVPFVQRMMEPDKYPDVPGEQPGTRSSHLMEYGEADDKYYAYPTLVHKGGTLTRPEDPMGYALESGNVMEFGSEEEASKFAGGSWKTAARPKKGGSAMAESVEERRQRLATEVLESRLRTKMASGETGLQIPLEDVAAQMGEEGVPMYQEPKTTVSSLSPYAKTLGFEVSPEGEPFIPAETRMAEEKYYGGIPAAQGMAQAAAGGMGIGGGPSLAGLQGAISERAAARPGMLEAMQGPFEQQAAATEQARIASLGALGTEQATRDAQLMSWETEQAKQQEREAERQTYVQAEFDKVRSQIADIEKSGVDPKRLYKNPDGSNNFGKSVMAAVAVGLGALAQSRMGGANNALRIITAAIDRDIDAQKSNLANRRAGVGMGMNMLGRMQSQFTSERQQDAATRMFMLKTAEMEMNKVAAQSKGPMVEANYAALQAGIEGEKVKAANTFMEATRNQDVADEAAMLGARQKQYAGRVAQQAAQAKAMAKAEPAAAPMRGFQAFRSVGKDEAKEARKIDDSFRPLLTTIDKIVKLRNDVGPAVWPSYVSEHSAEIRTMRQDLLMLTKEGFKLGALQEHEMKFMEEMIPDVGSLGNVVPQLEAMHGQFAERYNDQMYNRGYSSTTSALEGFRPAGETQ